MQHSPFYDWLCDLLSSWLSGAKKAVQYYNPHLVNKSINHNGVCRATPGFTRAQ